ncbi:cytochrome c peroxidase [Thalassoglobus sp. JC818]|uniref:cytochrome c peroxidase n=1 Tax=Thalassoglobus sp. JC818 TaxID=3232136 RepID=UPI003458C8BF
MDYDDLMTRSRTSHHSNSLLRTPIACCLLILLSQVTSADEIRTPLPLTELLAPAPTSVRRPTQMEWVIPGEQILIANPRSSSLSIVSLTKHDSIAEFAFSGNLSALASIPSSTAPTWQRFALTTSSPGRLTVIEIEDGNAFEGESLDLTSRRLESHVAVHSSTIAVSSVWDRCVWLIDDAQTLSVSSCVELSFEAGKLQFSPDGKYLVVADAFGGHLALIESSTGSIVDLAETGGHNIGGLSFLSPSRLMITHQMNHASGATTIDQIANGAVIENVIQEFDLQTNDVGSPKLAPRLIGEMGEPSHGAADPGAIAIDRTGSRFVAISGNDEVLRLNNYGVNLSLISVGDGPVDLLLSPDEKWLYCLNQFDESISVISTEENTATKVISIGDKRVETPADRGERLFFDGSLSRFEWFSCHSCHVRGHTHYGLADTFGDGNSGAPKRVLSLLGGRDNTPWGWNGSKKTLHDQVRQSALLTMRGETPSAREVNDLVAYLHTLDSPPPFRPSQGPEDSRQISHGQAVFQREGCANCHVPPLTFTSDSIYNVGIADEHGNQKFNPPSLNGVGYRRGLFHDRRAETLRDVIVDQGHQLDESLNSHDAEALIRFLESL